MDYTFIIRFNDDNHSLSSTNGIPIDSLGELLASLGKAIGLKKGDNLTLSEIRGNCYALGLTTNSEPIHSSLKVIHKQISENDYSGLNSDQKKYAAKLKAVMGNKYRVNTYDNNKEFDYKINQIQLSDTVESYFEVDDIYGIVASIGSSNLHSKSSIKLSEEGYEIQITSEQEDELIKCFKKNKLLLRIKKKINTETGKIESAVLIDFGVVKNPEERLADKAEELKGRHRGRGIFPKVKDSVLSVRGLRGSVNPNQLVGDGQ
ncbi:MAG: hypothetical protein LBQ78_04325 [Tannerellaceae bacterium]|jgi:hypothetical protein|nr:hypothetical protein [Tannerellaceae bacterium]